MQAELERVREENRQLQEERARETDDGTERHEMEMLLEEQRQLYEDLQAELGEAVDRSTGLEDKCCSLEDQLVKVMEESELERLKAVNAIRSKYEETFMQQVQELQKQVQELQSSGKVRPSGENGSHKLSLTKETTKPGCVDLSVCTDKGTTSSTDKPAGVDNADNSDSKE